MVLPNARRNMQSEATIAPLALNDTQRTSNQGASTKTSNGTIRSFLNKRIREIEKEMAEKNKIISEQARALDTSKKELADKDKTISEHERALDTNKNELADKDKIISEQARALDTNKNELADKDKTISEQKRASDTNKKELAEKNKTIDKLETALSTAEKDRKRAKAAGAKLKRKNKTLNVKIEAHEAEKQDYQREIDNLRMDANKTEHFETSALVLIDPHQRAKNEYEMNAVTMDMVMLLGIIRDLQGYNYMLASKEKHTRNLFLQQSVDLTAAKELVDALTAQVEDAIFERDFYYKEALSYASAAETAEANAASSEALRLEEQAKYRKSAKKHKKHIAAVEAELAERNAETEELHAQLRAKDQDMEQLIEESGNTYDSGRDYKEYKKVADLTNQIKSYSSREKNMRSLLDKETMRANKEALSANHFRAENTALSAKFKACQTQIAGLQQRCAPHPPAAVMSPPRNVPASWTSRCRPLATTPLTPPEEDRMDVDSECGLGTQRYMTQRQQQTHFADDCMDVDTEDPRLEPQYPLSQSQQQTRLADDRKDMGTQYGLGKRQRQYAQPHSTIKRAALRK